MNEGDFGGLERKGERIFKKLALAAGVEALLIAENVRREKTGVHATVSIGIGTTLIERDTFNIERREERNRLVNAALKSRTAAPVKDELVALDLEHEMLRFLENVWPFWLANERLAGWEKGDAAPSAPRWSVPGLILEGSTGIHFGNAGSGKSTFLRVLAQSLQEGIADIVPIRSAGVGVWVNAEEPPIEHTRQFGNVNAALGIDRATPVYTVDARGMPISDVAERVRVAVERQARSGKPVYVFVDSLSRLAQGSNLNDNNTATLLIDSLAGLPASITWIGHTGQSNEHRLAGSKHFENAARLMVRVQGRISRGIMNPELTRGLRVSVTKANGAAPVDPMYWTMHYHRDYGFAGMVPATSEEWPVLRCEAVFEGRDGAEHECGKRTWDGVLPRVGVRCAMHRDDLTEV